MLRVSVAAGMKRLIQTFCIQTFGILLSFICYASSVFKGRHATFDPKYPTGWTF